MHYRNHNKQEKNNGAMPHLALCVYAAQVTYNAFVFVRDDVKNGVKD